MYYTLMMHRDVLSETYSEVVFLLTRTHTFTNTCSPPHSWLTRTYTYSSSLCALSHTLLHALSVSLSLFCTPSLSLSTPMPGSSATHIALGLCLRSEDMEHLCGSPHLTTGQRMGQGLSGLHTLSWTHTHNV